MTVQGENKASKGQLDLPETKERKVHRVTRENLERTVPTYASFQILQEKITSIVFINFRYDFRENLVKLVIKVLQESKELLASQERTYLNSTR